MRVLVGEVHQGVVRHTDHPPARVAGGVAEGVELLEEDALQARLLAQLAAGGVVERLVELHESARQRPSPTERFAIALDQSTVTAGAVEFSITDNGPSEHEFVVFKTDLAPEGLPTK